jgi:hypothetical protein
MYELNLNGNEHSSTEASSAVAQVHFQSNSGFEHGSTEASSAVANK